MFPVVKERGVGEGQRGKGVAAKCSLQWCHYFKPSQSELICFNQKVLFVDT